MNSSHFLICVLGTGIFVQRLVAEEPRTANPVSQVTTKNDVGVSSRDGITISGVDVHITRNGLTEKLTKEFTLPNGLRVQLDGTVIARDGSVVALRPTQVLTLDGRFVDVPVIESVVPTKPANTAPAVTPPTKTVSPATPMPTTLKPATPKPKTTKEVAEDAARGKGPIKAGEGVQK